MITLSITQLREHNACDIDERATLLCWWLGRDVPEDEPVPLTTWANVPWDASGEHPTGDLLWSLRCCGEPGRAVAIEVACRAAERVLHLTHEQDRAMCQEAIDAARSGDRERAQRASDAAWAAASAAAWAAASDAAWAAASDAASAAASDAASAAASAAARAAAWAEVRRDLLALIGGAL